MSAPDSEFAVHPQLLADSRLIGRFELCQLRLSEDARYPWFILIPERTGIREIYELSEADQRRLLNESMALSRALMQVFNGDKLNIAALGNMVPQLHLHHIVRYTRDAAWPAPVWGRHPALPYTDAVRSQRIVNLRKALPLLHPAA